MPIERAPVEVRVGVNRDAITVLNNTFQAADSATFDQLNISFLVQENFANYFELHDWMRAISFPESFEDRKNLVRFEGDNSYGFLTINNSYNEIDSEVIVETPWGTRSAKVTSIPFN